MLIKRNSKFEKKIKQENIFSFFLNLKKKLDVVNLLAQKNISSFNSKKKNQVDPVTKFDIKIERIIRNEINKKFLNHSIFGEELKDQKNNNAYKWYIDPIDGTKSLILGLPNWSNLIGLYYKKECISSFANFPVLNELYLTKKKKVFRIKNNSKKLIKSNKNFNKKNIKLVINTFHTLKSKKILSFLKNFKGIFKVSGVDAYNFCKIADGRIDVLIESGLKKIDIYPLIKIIENSGAIITDWNGKNNYKNGDVIVAGNKKLHDFILKKIK